MTVADCTFVHRYAFILRDQWRQLLLIAGLFLFQSGLDLLGVGLIGPFIAAVVDPAQIARYAVIKHVLEGLGGTDVRLQLASFGGILLAVFLTKGLAAYRIQRRIFTFSFGFRAHLVERLMGAYLRMPYQFYLDRNSSTLIQSVTRHTKTMADDMLIPSLRLLSDSLMLIVLGTFLVMIDPLAMAIFASMLAIVFFFYIRAVRPRVKAAGETAARTSERVIRGVSQGIGGIKEVRILGVELPFFAKVRQAAQESAAAEAGFYSLLTVPRYLMETTVILFVILFSVLVLYSGNGGSNLVATLAMFGAAGIRLLPATVQVSASLASMNYSSFALGEVYADLAAIEGYEPCRTPAHAVARAAPSSAPAAAFESLRLADATFTYPQASRPAVAGVTLEIRRGNSVGLIGESGSGKTTLVDILLGLHPLDKGSIFLNGEPMDEAAWSRWAAQVAYIPQTVFLIDDSLERNIAFGVEDGGIDRQRVMEAVELAQLKELVARLPEGLQTTLGERGVRLSGGERQRVALARAFYHNRSIFVLDEATSALDVDTEREVIKVIEKLRGNKTLVVIAHRLTTVSGCDVVYRLQAGRLVASGKLEDVVNA